MHNECNSEMEVDEICHDKKTGVISSANISDINDPTSCKAIKSQKESQAQLRKKKNELAAAEALVSHLRTEIKTLEASTLGFGGTTLAKLRYTNKHRCPNDQTSHKAKRMKEKAIIPSFTSGTSRGSRFHDEISSPKNIFPATEKISFSNAPNTAREDDYSSAHSEIQGIDTFGSLECSQAEDQPNNLFCINDSDLKFVPVQTNENQKQSLKNSGCVPLDLGSFACRPSAGGILKQIPAS